MEIVDYDMSGRGVGREDKKVYFVKNALIGEEVEVKLLSEGKSFSVAESVRVKTKSAEREKPQCKYFGICGGCQTEHMSKSENLLFKRSLISNTLKKVAGLEVDVMLTVGSDKDYHYRNKSVFAVRVYDGGTHFGMYKEGGREFVEIESCALASEGINTLLGLTAKFYLDKEEPNLKHLVLREAGDEFLITLVTKGKLKFVSEYLETLKLSSLKLGVFVNHNKLEDEILSGDFEHIYGLKSITLSERGVQQKIYPGSFLQVNTFVKEKLYDKVLEFVGEKDRVIDAYCGAGHLSLLLSQKVKSVVGIENVPSAVESANEIKRSQGAKNLSFVLNDVKQKIGKILAEQKSTTVVLDPPRKGCDKKVLETIGLSKADKIIYISCSPISLAKDIKILTSFGFKIAFVQGFDMFPNTANVETLALLTRSVK